MPQLEPERFADFLPGLRQRKLEEARLVHDWLAAHGPLGGTILHLRDRARNARRSALVFLVFLLATVIFGLAFYLGLPFWQQFADGRRSTLEDTMVATERVLVRLVQQREAERTKLVDALRMVAEEMAVPGENDVSFIGALATGPGSALIFAADGTILPWSRASGFGERYAIPDPLNVDFYGELPTSTESALVHGKGGLIFPWPLAGGIDDSQPNNESATMEFRGAIATSPDSALMFGTQGTIVHWTRAGGIDDLEPLFGLDTVEFRGAIATSHDSALIYGTQGTIVPWTRGGGFGDPEPLSGLENVMFLGAIETGPDSVLLFGTQGTAVLWTRSHGFEVSPPRPEMEGVVFTSALATGPDSAVLFGYGGAYAGLCGVNVKWTRAGGFGSEADMPGSQCVYIKGVLSADNNSALIFGDEGTIVAWTGSTGFGRPATLPGLERTLFEKAVATGPDTVLVFGQDSIEFDSGAIGSAIVLVSDDFSHQASALVLTLPRMAEPANLPSAEATKVVETGPVADPLVAFITSLPPDARARPSVQDALDVAQGLVAREKVLEDQITTTRAALNGIDQFPYSYFLREKQREDFAAFMATCRGVTDWQEPPSPRGIGAADPDAVTAACLAGWRDQLASESETWWQTLAAQVPPGILLLFLLSTLAALYRYNLRLSGFHHARADALELLAMGKTKEEIETLAGIADVLAADKVVFGRDDAATRQAASILRSLLPGRSG